MKNGSAPFRVLLTHPPATSPALPSWDMAMLASRLADPNVQVGLYDANLDFYRRYCLDPERLIGWLARIESRRKAGVYEYGEDDIQRSLDPMGRTPDWWQTRVATAEQIIPLVCSREFTSPLRSVTVCRHIEDVLQIVSMAHFPTRIQWGRAALPQITDPQTAEALLENADLNPFLECYRCFMAPHIGDPDLKQVVVTVQESAQAFAGWTMARFIKSERPNLEVTLFGPRRLTRYASGDADHLMEWGDANALESVVGRVALTQPDAVSDMPDFTGLPLPDYLTPERVLPLEWVPHGATVLDVCAHLQKRYGATAFYSRSETLCERMFEVDPDHSLSQPPAHRLSLACRSTAQIDPDRIATAEPFGVRQIRWRMTGSLDPSVTPLPGRPYWQEIAEPIPLFTQLGRRKPRYITRLRIVDDPVRQIELGTTLQYHFQSPKELPEGYLDDICRMVEAGGSVGLRWVKFNLERAFLIGYATEFGVIVANSSLKHPRQEYIEKLERNSGIDVRGYLERGYTSVRPEYRGLGIGTQLLDGLTRRAGDRKIFSVIDEDNRATQKIAIRNRTRKVATFYSEKLEKTVGVWMPEWMIDE